jgi:hypothetical protein
MRFLGLLSLLALASVPAVADEASVRRAIEQGYEALAQAHAKRDLAAILALKTADFHSVGPDGRVSDAALMADYSKRFLDDNKPPLVIKNTIRSISISPNETVAVVTVFQEVSRRREVEGKLVKVDTNVVQDETWVKTPQGWKIKLVANVRDMNRWVDGKRVDPSKPYDPKAAPFNPEAEAAKNALAAKSEVAMASVKNNSVGLTAWKLRDPDLFMSNVPKDFNVTKADGTKVTWDSLYESQKTRMAAVKHVDHLIVTIEVESANATDAVVLSTQDWSRVGPGADGKDTRLRTSVTHREIWRKENGVWKMLRFTEENPKREVIADATITDPVERYEVKVRLTDTKG